jgi:hypothetical protein
MGAFAGLGMISREMYHRLRPSTSEITRKPLGAAVFRPGLIHY